MTGASLKAAVVVMVAVAETLGAWGLGETGGLGNVDGAGGGVSATAISTASGASDGAFVAGLGGTGGADTFVATWVTGVTMSLGGGSEAVTLLSLLGTMIIT